ncbi:GNAT family N-acetyltransferase [Candidatus Nitrososphaera sp. FF02]|uniref:GNAT family N-acetyltransferase n=1 Tax=Candidatus Nitrososphaera sp. FF02 TaxID=3398226 RepID=UPI0039E9EE37
MTGIVIRPMTESDLPEADRIFRLAFGTFLGMPDPMAFSGDADYIATRYRADPPAALAAEVDGRLAGSNFALHWGSVGVFGPLTVHPDFWDRGVARHLLDETMGIFEKWQVSHAGLFTFAQSSKHVHLYQKFGFWPRFLTAIMSKPVEDRPGARWVRYSELSADGKAQAVEACKSLADEIYAGLDLRMEINSIDSQRLGDTILTYDGSSLAGFANCHCGAGTETSSGNCYVKFGAARLGSALHFDGLLDACESFAHSQGLSHITAGVNTARHGAYKSMIARKFRTDIQGVTMHRPNEPGYNRKDVYLIDDWR